MTFLMENPWPLAIGLAALGLLLGALSLQSGSVPRLALAGALLTGAVVVVCWSLAVKTSGEHAADTVGQMIVACEQANLPLAQSLVEGDATLKYDSDGDHERPRAEIDTALDSLRDRNRIEENYIFAFHAETIDENTGRVDLTCRTKTASSFVPILNHWFIDVKRQPDGSWRIHHIWFRSLKGAAAAPVARQPRSKSP